MFRTRLTIALAVLAAAAVLQGAAAVWSIGQAETQVLRGRVASDIQLGFAELAGNKQRLKIWLARKQFDGEADASVRDHLLAEMQRNLSELDALAQRAVALDDTPTGRTRQAQRHDALAVLHRSVDELATSLRGSAPLGDARDARDAWAAAAALFDISDGRDLRSLLAESVAREAQAVAEKRAAADRSLAWLRGLWLATAATIALAALLLSAHFTRGLRRPLEALHAGANALRRGELAHRIPLTGRDEFAAVAEGMNLMAAELAEHRQREADARQGLEAQVQSRTAELQQALQALTQADTRRRQLFADISHELRTPTTVIRGEAEITLRGGDKPAEDYRAALGRIVDTSRQLGLVIDDLLTMARSDTDALALQRTPLDLSTPLAEALDQAAALAHERGVQVQPAPLPEGPLPLLGDAQRLRQLLLVVLDNAVRYSRTGGVVRTRVLRLPGPQPRCQVEVVDNGIGIAADELPHVFDRNFRGRQARSHRADGSGLGLAIGQALARAHGGELQVASRPGQGTTVTLSLPLRAGIGSPA